MEKIALSLSNLMERKGWKKHIKEREIMGCWSEIAGKEIASFTKPLKVEKGIFVVGVRDSSWCHHLQFFRADLLEKIKKELPALEVKDINFTVVNYWKSEERGEEKSKKTSSTTTTVGNVKIRAEDKKVLQEIKNAAQNIPDEKIGVIVKRLAEKDLLLKSTRKNNEMPVCSLCGQEIEKKLIKKDVCFFCLQQYYSLSRAVEKMWEQTPWLSFEELKERIPQLKMSFYNYIKEQFQASLKEKITALMEEGELSSQQEEKLEKYLGAYIMNKCCLPPQHIKEEHIKKVSRDFPQIALFYFRK